LHDINFDLITAGCLIAPYSGLEPYAWKLASTVLRGKGRGNPAGLPGTGTAIGEFEFSVLAISFFKILKYSTPYVPAAYFNVRLLIQNE